MMTGPGTNTYLFGEKQVAVLDPGPLMPEHVHMLILPRGDDYSVSQILSDIKQPVTRRALKHLQATAPAALEWMRDVQPNGEVAHRFWQRGGGHDVNLSEPTGIARISDYIHTNPVRRGLVETPGDWRWSSARHYLGLDDVLVVPDVDSIPLLPCGRK